MKAKFLSWFRSLNLPSLEEWLFAYQSLNPKTKKIVIVSLVIFLIIGAITLIHLNNKLMVQVPLSGGVVNEGIVGSPRFVNPLLAVSEVDRDLVMLTYSGLYRLAPGRGYEADLAESMERSEDGLTYTIKLKPNLYWQDGEPITTQDILFTIKKTQDPDIKSPKRGRWNGVKVEILDEQTIKFTLKKPYNFFLDNLTLGILPAHLWSKINNEQFALTRLNLKPVGSGPYEVISISEDNLGIPASYQLKPFNKFALGSAKVNLNLYFYNNEEDLITDLDSGKIDAGTALSPQAVAELKMTNKKVVTGDLPRIFGVFYNQANNEHLIKAEVRQALDLAVDKQKIIDQVLGGYGVKLNGPLPDEISGQATSTKTNLNQAKELLAKNNLVLNDKGQLVKETVKTTKTKKGTTKSSSFGEPISISLATANIEELKQIAQLVAKDWAKLGIKVNLEFFEPNDLNQERIKPRRYEAILFGQVLGHDYDLYPFWHSSQRLDPGLNISLYVNNKVDKVLEGIRESAVITDLNAEYQKAQTMIAGDYPALFLYQPKFIYILPNKLKGVDLPIIASSADRFAQVHKWYFKTDRVWPIFISR